MVTLMSRVFGRGLDFKSNSIPVETAGGVCVICTFFPSSSSEEIQIRGRTARQGKKGSFELVLCQDDVQRDFAATKELLDQFQGSSYEFLKTKRETQTDTNLDAIMEQVKLKIALEILVD